MGQRETKKPGEGSQAATQAVLADLDDVLGELDPTGEVSKKWAEAHPKKAKDR